VRRIKFSPQEGAISVEALIIISVLVIFTGVLIYPIFVPMRCEGGYNVTCTSNQKQLALAFAIYIQENEGKFPPTENWATTIGAKGKILECNYSKKGENSYAYNGNLASMTLEKVGDSVSIIALTADSARPDALMYTEKDITPRNIKNAGAILSFVDGHVSYIKEDGLANVKFEVTAKNNEK